MASASNPPNRRIYCPGCGERLHRITTSTVYLSELCTSESGGVSGIAEAGVRAYDDPRGCAQVKPEDLLVLIECPDCGRCAIEAPAFRVEIEDAIRERRALDLSSLALRWITPATR